MTRLTLHIGSVGDGIDMNINWWDHNNKLHSSSLKIVSMEDHPRDVVITLDGKVIGTLVHTENIIVAPKEK